MERIKVLFWFETSSFSTCVTVLAGPVLCVWQDKNRRWLPEDRGGSPAIWSHGSPQYDWANHWKRRTKCKYSHLNVPTRAPSDVAAFVIWICQSNISRIMHDIIYYWWYSTYLSSWQCLTSCVGTWHVAFLCSFTHPKLLRFRLMHCERRQLEKNE